MIGTTRFLPVGPFQCSTPRRYVRRQPKSCFGENQLLPGSISFSLLVTSHPKALYDLRVRASLRLSSEFTLLMTSSPGFGSYAIPGPRTARKLEIRISKLETMKNKKFKMQISCWMFVSDFVLRASDFCAVHSMPCSDSLSLRLRGLTPSTKELRKLAGSFFNRHAVEDSTLGTKKFAPRVLPSSTHCRCAVSVLFHSPHRGSFHLSLTVLVHYRSLLVFSLTG